MFFPMHPRILLATRAHCWLVANLLYLLVQVVDKLTKTGPSRDPGGTRLAPGLQLDRVLLVTAL